MPTKQKTGPSRLYLGMKHDSACGRVQVQLLFNLCSLTRFHNKLKHHKKELTVSWKAITEPAN